MATRDFDTLARQEDAKINEWIGQIGSVYKPEYDQPATLIVSVKPILIYVAKHTINTLISPNHRVIGKYLLPWYKKRLQDVDCDLIQSWHVEDRLYFKFELGTKDIDELVEHLEEMDDDGNYPIKIARKEFLVKGDVVQVLK